MIDPKEGEPQEWEAEVDRLLDKLPGAPRVNPAPPGPPLAHDRPLPHARDITSGERLGTWARVVLGVLLGIGMTQWPYTHGCGVRLIFYLTGVAAVFTAGVWSSLSSWKRRLGVAHLLSQLLIIWGLLLGARVVLPRIGYAKVPAPWLCPDVANR